MNRKKKKSVGGHIVTQANNLIEADYSKASLSANSLKLFKLAIATLSPNDKDLRQIRIKLNVYKQYMGYKLNTTYGRLHKDLGTYCLALNSQAISILMEDGNILNAFAISSWILDHKKDELVIEISGQLKPFLLELKGNYTSYQLWNIPKLKSSYSIRLYELLCSHRRFGKRTFKVDELKGKVGCHYKEYGIFKKRVLLKAQVELKKSTDLRFEFEELKTGRKITDLVFYTYPNSPDANNPQQTFPFFDDEQQRNNKDFEADVLQAFQELGISKSNLDKMLSQDWNIINDNEARHQAQKRCHTIYEYYGEKLTLLQQSKEQKSPAGFFIKAVKEDWQNPSLFKKKKIAKKRKAIEKVVQEIRLLEKRKEEKLKELNSDKSETIFAYFNNRLEELQDIIDKVLPIGNAVRGQCVKPNRNAIENYQNSSMLNALVNIEFEKNYPHLLTHLQVKEQEIQIIQDKVESLKLKM